MDKTYTISASTLKITGNLVPMDLPLVKKISDMHMSAPLEIDMIFCKYI
jgi:hypothetical protein